MGYFCITDLKWMVMSNFGEEKEGLGGAGGSLDVSWRRCPATVVVEDEPFLFFDGSSIWDCFSWFWLVGFIENWKRWNLNFVTLSHIIIKDNQNSSKNTHQDSIKNNQNIIINNHLKKHAKVNNHKSNHSYSFNP